jgi:hypothetical protein
MTMQNVAKFLRVVAKVLDPKQEPQHEKAPPVQKVEPPKEVVKPEVKRFPDNLKCRREVKDTYEAAYYLTKGAEIESVRTLTLSANRADRKGYKQQWIMQIKDVPVNSVGEWQSGKASSNVQELESARIRLKRWIKRSLEQRW